MMTPGAARIPKARAAMPVKYWRLRTIRAPQTAMMIAQNVSVIMNPAPTALPTANIIDAAE